MNKLKTTVLLLGLILSLSSTAIAQQENETQNQMMGEQRMNNSTQMMQECIIMPVTVNDSESYIMKCQHSNQTFYAEDDWSITDWSPIDWTRDRMGWLEQRLEQIEQRVEEEIPN